MPQASRTAIGVLIQRAIPAEGEPQDEAALRLLAGCSISRVAGRGEALWTHVRERSRFAEDRLREAVDRGVRQYVLLGAGFDTFAHRQPDWARELAIFEVDHPESQAAKRDAIRCGGLESPPNVRYVADDLEQDRLLPHLIAAGFDPTRPAFFACLGVLVYLTRSAGDRIFDLVGSLPGSAIAFTFAQPGVSPELAARVEALGEPFRTFDTPEDLVRNLLARGFRSVEVPEDRVRASLALATAGS